MSGEYWIRKFAAGIGEQRGNGLSEGAHER